MKIYLIYSDSYKRINEKVNEIINGFSSVLKFDLKVNSIIDVTLEANYYSLTGEEKCIIVKSNDLFIAKKNKEEGKNKNEELLLKYIENPNSLVTLIFTSNEIPDKRKKIFKTISEKGKYTVPFFSITVPAIGVLTPLTSILYSPTVIEATFVLVVVIYLLYCFS